MYKHARFEHDVPIQKGKWIEAALLGRVQQPSQELLNAQKRRDVFAARAQLSELMSGIRQRQIDNPAAPKRPFLKKLLEELQTYLQRHYQLSSDRYQFRAYSAIDTILDKNGIDFWLELVDVRTGNILADYKVDVTSNAEKINPKNTADKVYYHDTLLEEQDGMEAIYRGTQFKGLVESAARNLFMRSGLSRSH